MFLLKECPDTLDLFVAASKTFVERSMKISGQKVFSNPEPSTMVVPGTRECIVSFDASWHRRGHFSNQGFAGAIDSSTGKCSIMHHMIEFVRCALSGMKIANFRTPMISLHFGKNTAPLQPLITRGVPLQWKRPQQWRIGKDL